MVFVGRTWLMKPGAPLLLGLPAVEGKAAEGLAHAKQKRLQLQAQAQRGGFVRCMERAGKLISFTGVQDELSQCLQGFGV